MSIIVGNVSRDFFLIWNKKKICQHSLIQFEGNQEKTHTRGWVNYAALAKKHQEFSTLKCKGTPDL